MDLILLFVQLAQYHLLVLLVLCSHWVLQGLGGLAVPGHLVSQVSQVRRVLLENLLVLESLLGPENRPDQVLRVFLRIQ